jgi:hypothetical protein
MPRITFTLAGPKSVLLAGEIGRPVSSVARILHRGDSGRERE